MHYTDLLLLFPFTAILISHSGLGKLAELTDDSGGLVHGSEAIFLCASFGSALGALTGITPLILSAESAVGTMEHLKGLLQSCASKAD